MANQMVKRLMAICRAEGLQARPAPATMTLLKLAQGLTSILQLYDTANSAPFAQQLGVHKERLAAVSIRGVVLRSVPGAALWAKQC